MDTPVTTSNPYIGPRAFQTGEHIYGREREAGQLVNLLTAERIVLLHSPSGAGKTSLIQAAIIPRLLKRRFQVLPIIRVNLDPPAEVATNPEFNRYLFSALASLAEADAPGGQIEASRLASMTLSDHLAERGKANGGPGMQVLIFDQFEEILTLNPTDGDAKRAFLDQVGDALSASNRWALFAMREDYVGAFDPYRIMVPSRFANTFRLDLLGQEAARQAIQQPAREAGVDFEDSAAEKLVDDLRRVRVQLPDGSVEPQLGPHVEPVQLQVVCHRLWESPRLQADRITNEDLAAYGEVDRSLVDASLAQYYSERVAAISNQTGVSERSIREWFDRHLITEQKLRGTVLMGRERSGDLENRVIKLLIDAYLVRGEKRGGATWFELAHDRLIAPVVLNNAEWFKAHLSLLQQRADMWDQQDRAESLLLRGAELGVAEQWAKAHNAELRATETDYLAASREQAARALRIKRRNEIISVLALAATVLSIIALVLFKQAAVQRDEARRQERIARSGQLAAEAQAALPKLPARSLLLAVEALNVTTRTGEPRSALAENAIRAALADPRGVPLTGHEGRVGAVAFSPDGQWLATGSDDRTVRVWQLTTGTPPIVLRGHETPVTALAFSPDQRWLATGSGDKRVLLWDLRGGKPPADPLVLDGQGSDAYTLAFSRDGRWLAAGGLDGRVLLWDAANLGTAAKPFVLDSGQGSILVLAFSPDGRWLATGSNDRTVSMWDLKGASPAGATLTSLQGHTGVVQSLAFSPDGRWLASGSRDRTARLWDLEAGVTAARSQALPGHDGGVNGVAFSPDSRSLATASADKTVRLWQLDGAGGAALRHVLTGHEQSVNQVAFSPDGRWLATGSEDGTARLWDLRETDPASSVIVLRGHEDGISAMALSPDGRRLATGSKDDTARLWVVGAADPTGDPLVLRDSRAAVNALAFTPDGKWLAAGGGDPGSDQTDAAVRLWKVDATGLDTPPLLLTGAEKWIDALVSSRDGRWLAAAGGDNTIKVWDLATRDHLSSPQVLTGHESWIDALAVSPDGRWLASGSQDSTVRVWELSTLSGARSARVLKAVDGRVSAVVFSPDGHWLAAANEYAVLVWDLSAIGSGADLPVRILRRHSDFVTSLAFSPDSRWLATGSDDKTARLWDLAAADPARTSVELAGHQDQVKEVAFSPDGKWLATGSNDKTARLWRMNGARTQHSQSVLADHLEPITTLAFSPDSELLATGSQDSTIRLWNLRAADPAAEPVALRGHNGAVTAISFSPDGRRLASASQDRTVRLWSLSPDGPIALACRDAGRNLTEQEWRGFFPQEPYRKTCAQWP